MVCRLSFSKRENNRHYYAEFALFFPRHFLYNRRIRR